MTTNPQYPSKTKNPSGKGRGNVPKMKKNLIYFQRELDIHSRMKNKNDILYWKSRGVDQIINN